MAHCTEFCCVQSHEYSKSLIWLSPSDFKIETIDFMQFHKHSTKTVKSGWGCGMRPVCVFMWCSWTEKVNAAAKLCGYICQHQLFCIM